jgi:ABC-type multidrug transport system fused ATPase/permease subunit
MIIGQSDTPALTFERSIEIQDLCYQYPGSVEFSLCNISLSIKRGMSIGIIGKSGAGKSTLADVVLGLLTPSSGAILVDGINIHENNTAWQQLIGYVQQDIFLLDDSIRRNIAFGLPEDSIDTKRMNGVVVESQLEEFISSLPDGLNTQLGERGVRLSGGQKQRIGIARALYRNSSTLIFDEATSALDNETESEIVSAINNLKGTRTIIVIAHRLSTTEHCDRVIELTDGGISKIIERNINS